MKPNNALNSSINLSNNSLNHVCAEEAEILSLLESREDINSRTQAELTNLLHKVKKKESFKYSIFRDTLNKIDLEIHDLSYFKCALTNNLRDGFVRPIKKTTSSNSKRKEYLPEWYNGKKDEKVVEKSEKDEEGHKQKMNSIDEMLKTLNEQRITAHKPQNICV